MITMLRDYCGMCNHSNKLHPSIIIIIIMLITRSHAVDYYSQAGNVTKMAESYYVLEEYSKLETLVNTLPENHALLEV